MAAIDLESLLGRRFGTNRTFSRLRGDRSRLRQFGDIAHSCVDAPASSYTSVPQIAEGAENARRQSGRSIACSRTVYNDLIGPGLALRQGS